MGNLPSKPVTIKKPIPAPSTTSVQVKGDKGDKGEKGDKGDKGEKGDPGLGVFMANGDVAMQDKRFFLRAMDDQNYMMAYEAGNVDGTVLHACKSGVLRAMCNNRENKDILTWHEGGVNVNGALKIGSWHIREVDGSLVFHREGVDPNGDVANTGMIKISPEGAIRTMVQQPMWLTDRFALKHDLRDNYYTKQEADGRFTTSVAMSDAITAFNTSLQQV